MPAPRPLLLLALCAAAAVCVKAQDSVQVVEDLDFPQFFVAHAVPGVPAIVKHIDNIDRLDLRGGAGQDGSLQAAIHSCCKQDSGGPVYNKCPDIAERLVMPRIVVNDYTLRLHGGGVDNRSWTQVQRISSGAAPPPLSCPHGMHLLAVVLEGAITASVHAAAAPPPGSAAARRGSKAAQALASSRATALAQGEGVSRGTLAAGDALFAPGGRSASLAAGADTTLLHHCFVDASNFNSVKAELSAEAAAGVRESMALLRALTAPELDRGMRRAAEGEVLSALWRTPYTTLPSSATASGSGSGSSADEGSSDSSGGGGSGADGGLEGGGKRRRGRKSFREWQDMSRWNHLVLSLTLPIPTAAAAVHVERTSATVSWLSSFEARKDDHTPVRFNVTWCQSPADASTAVEPAGGSAAAAAACPGGGYSEVALADAAAEAAAEVAAAAAVGSAKLLASHGGPRQYAHTLPPSALAAGSEYTISVALVYGDVATPPSPPSPPARTLPLGAPTGPASPPLAEPGAQSIALAVMAPEDDGGAPVLRWHVAGRTVADGKRGGGQNAWAHMGMFPATQQEHGGPRWERDTITIEHLAPETEMEFRVCAQNAVGTGDWTPASAPAAPLRAVAAPTALQRQEAAVQGLHARRPVPPPPLPARGGADVWYKNVGGQRLEGAHAHAERGAAFGPTVVLDDEEQRVIVLSMHGAPGGTHLSNGADLQVWSGQYSPRTHLVTAELVPVDPPDASAPLANPDLLRGRVALVRRGGVPLVNKVAAAQRAGALGVVIADDGHCTRAGGFSQFCMPGSHPPGGWAAQDNPAPWLRIRIPHVLMLQEDADALVSELPPPEAAPPVSHEDWAPARERQAAVAAAAAAARRSAAAAAQAAKSAAAEAAADAERIWREQQARSAAEAARGRGGQAAAVRVGAAAAEQEVMLKRHDAPAETVTAAAAAGPGQDAAAAAAAAAEHATLKQEVKQLELDDNAHVHYKETAVQ